jgi:hypothetical protein
MEKRKGFFFEKKKQKIFLNWAVLVSLPQTQTSKSFCAAFFKKRPLPAAWGRRARRAGSSRCTRAGAGARMEKRKSFFFEKKKQKTSLNWAVLVSAPQAQTSKSFCAAFFQKAATSLPS